jgi:hypothetical protein
MFASPTRRMTQEELDRICRIWAGGDADEYPEERDAIIAIATDCGLRAGMENRVLRVQKTQQLHDEILSKWR